MKTEDIEDENWAKKKSKIRKHLEEGHYYRIKHPKDGKWRYVKVNRLYKISGIDEYKIEYEFIKPILKGRKLRTFVDYIEEFEKLEVKEALAHVL